MSYIKDDIIESIKTLLLQCDESKGKENKKNIALQIMNFLYENSEFVTDHPNFKKAVIAKCREFKKFHSEYPDLMESIDKLLNFLNEPLEDPLIEKYKEMSTVFCEDGISVSEHIHTNRVIFKYGSVFRSYTRGFLLETIQNTGKYPNGETVNGKDVELFKSTELVFFEMINTGEDSNILLPYETKTFINKYKV
jgi:hypothetical protein